ncbi:MAG: hypothetical protein KDD60_08305, partial [Bdellovibrionales bacterium]|nr:hypothetical protein [Bdellovibrionales bacterium]
EEVRLTPGVNGFSGISDFYVETQGTRQITGETLEVTHTSSYQSSVVWSVKNIFQPEGPIPLGAKILSARFGFQFKRNELATAFKESLIPVETLTRIIASSSKLKSIRNIDSSASTQQRTFVDVTEQIRRMSVGTPVFGFYLDGALEGTAQVYSASHPVEAYRPILIVRYDPADVFLPSGDSDGNGIINDIDLDYQARILSGEIPYDIHFDIDKNGVIDRQDRTFEILYRAHTIPGDANLDYHFNSSDLVQLFTAGQFEDSISKNSTWSTGDFDGDLEFTANDYVYALQIGTYED